MPKTIIICYWAAMILLIDGIIVTNTCLASTMTNLEECRAELLFIKAHRNSLAPRITNDLDDYEKFADGIQKKWSQQDKTCYARLMLELCKPLSSGGFKDDRSYELARKYALAALARPDEIPITLELELIGHLTSLCHAPEARREDDFAERRKLEVEIRLHAWRRLIDAVESNWEPNDIQWVGNVAPPAIAGLPSGVEPEAIKDADLRSEYEEAIEMNRQKAEKYTEQRKLRKWLLQFPKRSEEYVICLYSLPPLDLDELNKYLDKYIVEINTKKRILDAVKEETTLQ